MDRETKVIGKTATGADIALIFERVHTRALDRAVAKKTMSKRYSQLCKSGRDKYGHPIHNRYHSKKGANHKVAPIREKQSYFAAQWKRYC